MRNGIRFLCFITLAMTPAILSLNGIRGLREVTASPGTSGGHAHRQEADEDQPAEKATAAENGLPEAESDEKRTEAVMTDVRKLMELKMNIRVQEMQDICHLDEKQVLTLRVASRGAIVQEVAQQKENMRQMRAMFGPADVFMAEPVMEFDQEAGVEDAEESSQPDDDAADSLNGPPDPANPSDKADGIDLIQGQNVVVRGFAMPAQPAMAMGVAFDVNVDIPMGNMLQTGVEEQGPWNQAVWLDTVKSTLSEDQLRTLAAVDAERAERARKLHLQAFLQRVDQELRLSEKQRTELEAFIETNYGTKVAALNSLTAGVGANSNMMMAMFEAQAMPGMDVPAAPKDAPHQDELKKIFSADQMALWTKSFGEAFRMLGMIDMQGGNQGVFFGPQVN